MIDLGIDIGGTKVKIGEFDSDSGQIISTAAISYHYEDGIDELFNSVKTAINISGVEHINGIGVSVAGNITKEGILTEANNLSINGINIRHAIWRNFNCNRVSIINDADAAAVAELFSGSLSGHQNAMMLTIGTGIGGAVIINGKVYSGGNHNGIEIGHMIVDRNGDKCSCGNRGCVETICSAAWIVEQGKKRFGQEVTDAKYIIDKAKIGDGTASAIIREYCINVSTALASLVAIFDPEKIVIGGGISHAGRWLLEPIENMLWHENIHKFHYPLEKAFYGNEAGIIGAVISTKEDGLIMG